MGSSLPTDNLETEVFSFVLTESDGDRRFGYCMRKLPVGTGLRYPIAFCVLSFFPCFPMFAKMLEHVAYQYENCSSQDLSKFISELLAQPLPKPGETFEVNLNTSDSQTKWRFTRPNEEDSFLEHVAFEPLLNHLDPEMILILFASLLVERRTIFISSKLSLLSSCVQSLLALLYPLAWQHICIPVLPASLLSFCCAPMPFVVGIMPSSLPEMRTLPMEEVLIVDIDNQVFLQKPSFVDDYQLLPDDFWAPVLRAIKDAKKNIKKHKKRRMKIAGTDHKMESDLALYDGKIIGKALADVFLTFFVKLLGTYRVHIKDSYFDKEEFIESQKTWEQKQFMELFCGSQMFEMFIAQRKQNQFRNSTFEKRVQMTKLESDVKMMVTAEDKISKGKRVFGAFKKKLLSKQSPQAAGNFVISTPTFKGGSRDIGSATPPTTHAKDSKASATNSEFITVENGHTIFTATAKDLKELPPAFETPDISKALLSKNLLSTLPSSFACMDSLTFLDLSNNKFKEIPPILSTMNNLVELNLKGNCIADIPGCFVYNKSLARLNLDNNQISVLPPSMGKMEGLVRFSVAQNQLTSMPPLDAPHLKRLNVSKNQLEELPPIGKLKSLANLNLDSNQLRELPQDIAQVPLTEISARSNKISDFTILATCKSLKSISLDRNIITEVPVDISSLRSLTTLSLVSNKISTCPKNELLAAIPNLTINLKSNPCSVDG